MDGFADLNKQLYDAVEGSDVELAVCLLEKEADVDARGGDLEWTVLMKACENGCKEIVDLLLKHGASIDETNSSGNTALMLSSLNGHDEIVTLLVKNRADVDKKGLCGLSAIHCAATNSHSSTVSCLVSCGATIDIEDDEGKTPLWFAGRNGHVNCVDVLLSAGAIPDHNSQSEGSPVEIAKLHSRDEIVKMMEESLKSLESSQQNENQLLGEAATAVLRSGNHSQATQVPISTSQQEQTESFDMALRSPTVSPTAGGEEAVTQLMEQVAHLRRDNEEKERLLVEISQQKEQKQNELDASVREKRVAEREIEQMRQQIEALQQVGVEKTAIEQQKEQLSRDLDEEQREKNELIQEKEALEQALNEERGEKTNIEELLTVAEVASAQIRLQHSEEVLHIPSRDIRLTDRSLGSGSFGDVRIAYWRDCPVAVKMLYEVLAAVHRNICLLQQEVSIAWKIHHPNIATVYGITLEIEDEKKTAWIVMELLQGSMSDVIDATLHSVPSLSLREKVDMTHDSLSGLSHLHSLTRVVLHGDIRPTNILVTAVMQAKLGDLGAARFNDASLSVGLLSPDYTATERLDGRLAQKSKETDVYSMGVSVCELFTGVPPSRATRLDQVQRIYPRSVRVLCARMVSDDPNRRPSAAGALISIGRIRETDQYKECLPRRMVKGKLDGVDTVTLTDRMW